MDRLQKDQTAAKIPFFITGDMNSNPDYPSIQYVNRFPNPEIADITVGIPLTFHNFGTGSVEFTKIDYIFTETAKTVKKVSLWDDFHAGIYLSDHYPVCAELDF